MERSRAWSILHARFGEQLTVPVLRTVAVCVGQQVEQRPSREVRKRKAALVKWLDQHIEPLKEVLPRMAIGVDHPGAGGCAVLV